jgi:hypothetical protein
VAARALSMAEVRDYREPAPSLCGSRASSNIVVSPPQAEFCIKNSSPDPSRGDSLRHADTKFYELLPPAGSGIPVTPAQQHGTTGR